ncbi:MAG: hypothetical protein EPN91_01145 [Salinibacterium sp.]|nr:MAG: hypothetical protein EPN91_01145 [Salinibacterium sp.]
MKRLALLSTVTATVLILVLPFVGGGGPGIAEQAAADSGRVIPELASAAPAAKVQPTAKVALAASGYEMRIAESAVAVQVGAESSASSQDFEHLAQKAVPKPFPVTPAGRASGTLQRMAAYAARGQSCPGNIATRTSGAPSKVSALGVGGTTSGDLALFAATYNQIRVANCLQPVRYFRYDSCTEQRLFWMAESPSLDPNDAWGHMGSTRSDGVPSVGCDGNLAGGSGNTGATVATKWWNSPAHRASLYRPGSSVGSNVCIAFAMTHGGVPNEPYSFTRAAARWTYC